MPNVEVQNPRLPKFGQAVGPAGGISSDVFEMYAPQMAMTDFQTADMPAAYQMRKDIYDEEQAQIDAQIAQSKFAQAERERGADRQAKAAKKSKKVQAAATGAKIGSSFGIPGAIVGTAAGWLFGEEGGMVPDIHPRSMLFKEYQQGGDVTGYTGQGKFLQRGLQNLQFRQDDLSRLTENVDKMGKYGFWDAAMDIGKGYSAGKNIAGSKGFSDLMTGLKDVKQYGFMDAFKHHAARTGGLGDLGEVMGMFGFDQDKFLAGAQDTFKENITNLGKQQNPWIEQEETQSLLDFLPKGSGKYNPAMTTVKKAPVRETALGMSPFKKAFRSARKLNQKTFDYDGKMYTTELR